MTDLRLSFDGEKVGRAYSRNISRNRTRVLAAMRGTADAIATKGLVLGRADIKKASPAFAKSKRWAPGLFAKITEGGGVIKVTFGHIVSYFMVHQKGATIRGKPLLWIPLSFAKDAQGIMARDFKEPLFRVDRAGKAPLLLSAADKQPKYFGIEEVKIPKRFHVIEIIRDLSRNASAEYRKAFRGGFGVNTRG